MSFANCAIGCAVAGLCLLNSDPVAAEQSVALSLPEARSLAVHALNGERPALASQIAQGLLIADPHSAYAHYVLATAHADMGHGTDGRKSAARAYRYADTRVQKFQAAELAARLTFADGHPTLTQLWLRRAVQNAPTPEIEEQLARDYARVRRENPFRFSITGGVKPSSNVNNGADTAQQVIDGLPFTGRLSGSAQALSGIVGTVDAVVGYRLRSTQKTRTDLSGRLFVQRVALDSGSHDLAPEARNGDFGATYADVSLRQSFAVGAAAMLPCAAIEAYAGSSIPLRAEVLAAFVYVAFFPSLIAYVLYNAAVKRLGAAPAGQMITLMPLFGALLAAALLGEALQGFHATGMVFILGGIVAGAIGDVRRTRPDAR